MDQRIFIIYIEEWRSGFQYVAAERFKNEIKIKLTSEKFPRQRV
jgi:hypothetical protein